MSGGARPIHFTRSSRPCQNYKGGRPPESAVNVRCGIPIAERPMPRPSAEDSPRLARRNELIRTLRSEYRAPIRVLGALFRLTDRQVYRILAEGIEGEQDASRDVPAGLCSVA